MAIASRQTCVYTGRMVPDPISSHKTESSGLYRRTNQILLLVATAALAAPWFLIEWQPRVPFGLSRCFSLAIFGRPCPMCGLTRGLHAAWMGDWTAAQKLSPLSAAVFAILCMEILFRAAALCVRLRPPIASHLLRWDRRIHIALAAAYLVYAAAFTVLWR